jgi:hypothetical protein
MKKVVKPAKKPMPPKKQMPPVKQGPELRPKKNPIQEAKETLKRSSEIESGDDVIMKLRMAKSRSLKCGGKVKAMKKGGKC